MLRSVLGEVVYLWMGVGEWGDSVNFCGVTASLDTAEKNRQLLSISGSWLRQGQPEKCFVFKQILMTELKPRIAIFMVTKIN